MRITLTYNEGRACMTRLPDPFPDRMRKGRKHAWNRSHIYLLPPVGWRFVLNHLRDQAYGPRGGFKHHSDSLYSAIAKITRAVVEYELHPAFTEGRGVVGMSGEVVPAFVDVDGRRSPYPPGEFVLLLPFHVLDRGRKLTTWRPGDWLPGEDPLCREDFHLLIWREIGGVGSEL